MYDYNNRNEIYKISQKCKYDLGYSPKRDKKWLGINCKQPNKRPLPNNKCEYINYTPNYSIYNNLSKEELDDSKLECAYTKYNWKDQNQSRIKKNLEKLRKKKMLSVIKNVCKHNKYYCSKVSSDGTNKQQDKRCLIKNSCGTPLPGLSDFYNDVKDFYKVILELFDFSNLKLNIDTDKVLNEDKERSKLLSKKMMDLKEQYRNIYTPNNNCINKKGTLANDSSLYSYKQNCFTNEEIDIINKYTNYRDEQVKIDSSISQRFKKIGLSKKKSFDKRIRKLGKGFKKIGKKVSKIKKFSSKGLSNIGKGFKKDFEVIGKGVKTVGKGIKSAGKGFKRDGKGFKRNVKTDDKGINTTKKNTSLKSLSKFLKKKNISSSNLKKTKTIPLNKKKLKNKVTKYISKSEPTKILDQLSKYSNKIPLSTLKNKVTKYISDSDHKNTLKKLSKYSNKIPSSLKPVKPYKNLQTKPQPICSEKFIESQITNDTCKTLSEELCSPTKTNECPIQCCLNKILSEKRDKLKKRKESSFPDINQITKDKNLLERLSKLSSLNSDQTKLFNELKEKISNFKVSDKNVIVYEGLPTHEELNTCNQILGCKLTPEIIEKYIKNKNANNSISKFRSKKFLQEIKNIPQKRELNKIKKWIETNESNV